MSSDKLRDVSGILRIILHNIDNINPILDDFERDPMFSMSSQKYKAVNLRVSMHRIQVEIRDFLKEVKQYEETENHSNMSD